MTAALNRRLAAEALGTALLLATVVGSGIMGERLAAGNVAIALLANSIATGAALVALILALAPVSGAHFNPAVTLAAALAREMPWSDACAYIAVQIVAAFIGVASAHLMLGEPLFSASQHARSGGAQRWCAVVERICRNIRIAAGNHWLRAQSSDCDSLWRRMLHRCSLLVYRFDIVRESRGDSGPRSERYFRGNTSYRYAGVCGGTIHRCARSRWCDALGGSAK